MLNSLPRNLRVCKALLNNFCAVSHLRNYALFTVRETLNDTKTDAGTLQAVFAKHIALERFKDGRKFPPPRIRYSDFFPIIDERIFPHQLKIVTADQVPWLIVLAYAYRSGAIDAKHALVLNELDRVAMEQLDAMDTTLILETLYAFQYLIPHYLPRLDFYFASLPRLVDAIEQQGASKQLFVQTCFFLGAAKKHETTTKLVKRVFARSLTNYVSQLNHTDLAIVCNAAFKAAIKSTNQTFNQYLVDATQAVPFEQANAGLLATYIKSIRLQGVQSESTCMHLSNKFSDPLLLQQFSIVTLLHFFVFLVENRYDRPESTRNVINHLLGRLPYHNPKEEELRVKDLTNFIWCCASFNYKLSPDDLQMLERMIRRKLDAHEYRFESVKMIDTCLSLWTLGHQNNHFFKASIELRNEEIKRYGRRTQNDDNRFVRLLTSVAIEQPLWYRQAVVGQKYKPFDFQTPPPQHCLEGREELCHIAKQLKSTVESMNVSLTCPMRGFNVPSIMISRGDELTFIDLLRPTDQLLFSKQPNSVLRLKRQLHESMGHKVFLISSGDVESNTAYILQAIQAKESKQSIEDILQNAQKQQLVGQ